jgi:hypothetical protein
LSPSADGRRHGSCSTSQPSASLTGSS